MAVLAFIGIYIINAALSLPTAIFLTLVGGFLFGLTGVAYVNIGATLGAVIVFIIVRYLIGESIQKKYAEKLKRFNQEIKNHGPDYLITLRFIFIFPFFVINLLAGLTKVSLFTFFWTTMLGILPGSFAYVYAGFQLVKIEKPSGILSPGIIYAFLLIAMLSIVLVVYKKLSAK